MNAGDCRSTNSLALELLKQIDRLCDEFENACEAGNQPEIEDYLPKVVESAREWLLRELVQAELAYRSTKGIPAAEDEYRQRFPNHKQIIAELFARNDSTASWGSSVLKPCSDAEDDVSGNADRAWGEDGPCVPQQIGRYVVQRSLGRGTFGNVYLAYDPDLKRQVALKAPREHLFSTPKALAGFLIEAQNAARLDHPNIVRVYDVSRDSARLVIVMEYIEGSSLKDKMAAEHFSHEEIAELIGGVAAAVSYANQKGLVHRDLKPANILVGADGRPRVADFGLAVHEDVQRSRKGELAGTPPYMAPEQVRGETHRLDGRTDQWSLGVILYEMLTGRRPFSSNSRSELFDEIDQYDPKPPRQSDPTVPAELERICLKCLSKRMSDRYATVGDLAADLGHWLKAARVPTVDHSSASAVEDENRVNAAPAEQPPHVIHKGLRSFDEHDAYFFLELLPGPRDRDGLPDNIRFWKRRIEELDGDRTFSVGLIYGPSGCGKSSLVRAGLLPRLSNHVKAVYVEATAVDTEVRLLHGLRKHCPDIPRDMPLPEVLSNLRTGRWGSRDKLLIVLDQFEQWLQARSGEIKSQLTDALRHCDGRRVQCIVMVRLDFWMAARRFFHSLDVRLVEAENSMAVDLFDTDHARKVLAAFGRAFGKFPENEAELSDKQTEFIRKAAADLSEEGRVICVRLALFAEMMKAKPWTPATLKQAGGARGVGLTFLVETFSASTAPPEHRLHQKAASALLQALLPQSGTDIKGQMKSYEELLNASGYVRRPSDFDTLIRILDRELRLITPTDPEGTEANDDSDHHVDVGHKYYQLTHDYLLVPIREWLQQEKRATWRGRAEIVLAERCDLWTAKQQSRHLPSLAESARILCLTRIRQWTVWQTNMMKAAARFFALRGAILASLIALIAWFGYEAYEDFTADILMRRLLLAETKNVFGVLLEIQPKRRWLEPKLRRTLAVESDLQRRLHLQMALLHDDPEQLDNVYERVFDAQPSELEAFMQVLHPYQQSLIERLWDELQNSSDKARRIRAAAVLAVWVPKKENVLDRWAAAKSVVAALLVDQTAVDFSKWVLVLRRMKNSLLQPLADIYRDSASPPSQRALAANAFALYAEDRPDQLVSLLKDAEPDVFDLLFAALDDERRPDGEAIRQLKIALNDATEKQQATLLAALLRAGDGPTVWDFLGKHRSAGLHSWFAYLAGTLQVDPNLLSDRIEVGREDTPAPDQIEATLDGSDLQSTLILALGEAARQSRNGDVNERITDLHRSAPRARLIATSEWLLGKSDPRGPNGHTLVAIPIPSSRRTDGDEDAGIQLPTQRFALANRETTLLQFARFLRAKGIHVTADRPDGKDQTPVTATWSDAAEYCNWLSREDGLPMDQWCYTKQESSFAPVPGHRELTGYRLPSETEWWWAATAGLGEHHPALVDTQLLDKYVWYHNNAGAHSMPVATRWPNEFGLFDLFGNESEWCDDLNFSLGGSWNSPAWAFPSGVRIKSQLDDRNTAAQVSFRPARTLR